METLKQGLKWDKPEEAKLREFLVENKGFTESKVNNGLERLAKCSGKANQSRLDLFFKPSGMVTST